MKCPICGKSVDEAERGNAKTAYPFCSDRRQLIDLGRWLGGKYQVPVRPEEEGSDVAPERPPTKNES
jgi:endogenous inhibitor of DNA gyrase (YacG/DUF329 family)